MSPMPIKPTVFILLISQQAEAVVNVAIGPVFFNRLDADRASRAFPYSMPGTTVTVVEREVRGDMPQPVVLRPDAPPLPPPPKTVPPERIEIPPFQEDR